MKVSAFAIRRPAVTLLLASLVLLAAVPGLVRLELCTDGNTLVPSQDRDVLVDGEIRQRFDLRDPIVVLLRTGRARGIYDPNVLRWVRDRTKELEGIADVRPQDLTSLATETGLRFKERGLGYRTLLDPLPESQAEIDRLRRDVERIGLYGGTLVSRDGSATAIVLATPERSDRIALYRQVRDLALQGVQDGWRLDVLGPPVAEALLGAHILADLGLPEGWLGGEAAGAGRGGPGLVLWALLAMVSVFLVAFRRPAAALVPVAEAGGCLVVVFGAMGWLGAPVYIPTVVLPVILTAVGVADEIHIFRRYRTLAAQQVDRSRSDIVTRTMREMTEPVVRTSLTTAGAFLAFALSPLVAVRLFGLFTALGVLVCLAWSLTVVPACLVLLPKGWWGSAAAGGGEALLALARFAIHRRLPIVLGASLLVLLAATGATRLRVQDSWESGFATSSELVQATRWFDAHFLGSHQLFLEVGRTAALLTGIRPAAALEPFRLRLPADAWPRPAELVGSEMRIFAAQGTTDARGTRPREWRTWAEEVAVEGADLVLTMPRQRGSARAWIRPAGDEVIGYEIRSEPFAMPDVLRLVSRLEHFLQSREEVGGVLGPARYLETVSYVLHPESESSRQLPERADRARILWNNYTAIRGRERLTHLVDEDYGHAIVTAYVGQASYEATRRLIAAIREWQREHLEPQHLELRFAGDLAVSTSLVRGVVSTQLRSLLVSLLLVLAIAGALFRRWQWGLLCVLPPLLAVLFNFALMGWAHVPLGVATSMFAGMTLGVGVDYAIHLLYHYRRELESGTDWETSLAQALRFTGPAIFVDACAVGIGFGVLTLSVVPANARLGALLSLSVLHCLLSSLVLLPAILGLLAGGVRPPHPVAVRSERPAAS